MASVMAEVDWSEMAPHWQALSQGGWLVVGHWRRECWTVAWRDVLSIEFRPDEGGGHWPPARLGLVRGEYELPCHELGAARLRHWWHAAAEARAAVPRCCEVADLLDRPEEHGGRRWLSRVVLAAGPANEFVLGGAEPSDPHPAHQRLAFEPRTPEVIELLDSPQAWRRGGWRFVAGSASYVFHWLRPARGQRFGPMSGVLEIDRFEVDADHHGVPRTG